METSLEHVVATPPSDGLSAAAAQLRIAADAKKCCACGCLRHALEAIDRAIPEPARPTLLNEAVATARARLVPQRYECLGCEVCYPAAGLSMRLAR